jgi:hypothetical protein
MPIRQPGRAEKDDRMANQSRKTAGLSTILPRQELIKRFGSGLTLEEYGKTALKAIAEKNAGALHHVAASVWNRIVTKKWHSVNPRQFSEYFDTKNSKFYKALSESLGVEIIRDIYYVKGWASRSKRKSSLVVELLVAWVYRNDLLLADVTFMDPSRPIPDGEPKFALQTHKGLGLLSPLLANMQLKAEELGCEQLTLTAGTLDQVRLFEKHGFVVEDSEVGRRGVAWGVGVPMERNV